MRNRPARSTPRALGHINIEENRFSNNFIYKIKLQDIDQNNLTQYQLSSKNLVFVHQLKSLLKKKFNVQNLNELWEYVVPFPYILIYTSMFIKNQNIYARCTESFRSKPRYDHVSVYVADEAGKPLPVWFCQIQMYTQVFLNNDNVYDFALVKWYSDVKQLPKNNLLKTNLKSMNVLWEDTATGEGRLLGRRYITETPYVPLELIDIQTIVAIIHLLKNESEKRKNCYFVQKWTRHYFANMTTDHSQLVL